MSGSARGAGKHVARKGGRCALPLLDSVTMSDVRKTQSSFARKALAVPGHRFGDLYHLICRDEWLAEALRGVLRNTGNTHTPARRRWRPQPNILVTEAACNELIHALGAEGWRLAQWCNDCGCRGPIIHNSGRLAFLPSDRVVQMALKDDTRAIWKE